METWTTNNSDPAREWLRENYLTPAATKMQYTAGFPEGNLSLVNPSDWTLDFPQNEQGHEDQKHQLDLFHDYRRSLMTVATATAIIFKARDVSASYIEIDDKQDCSNSYM
jgi:hypothetical protein